MSSVLDTTLVTSMGILEKDADRKDVERQFESAKHKNTKAYKDPSNKRHQMATSEYIYQNQRDDATQIIELFKDNEGGAGMGNPCRVVSVKKHVKLGADGVILDVVRQMCTDPDNEFVISPDNVRIITGMSNRAWQDELREKAPHFLVDKIYHHGQLAKTNMDTLTNGLVIIDEIDTAIKEEQKLHQYLRNAGLFDFKKLTENRIYVVVISATLAKQLCELSGWGQAHQEMTMSVPPTYAGIEYFRSAGIAQPAYDMALHENVTKWLEEDVKSYGTDYRVHLLRLPRAKKNQPTPQTLIAAECKKLNIGFGMFSGSDPQRDEVWQTAFDTTVPLTRHYVLALKCGGLLRRATRIAESHKLRIGAVHVSPSKKLDYNVIAQDLIGRMCGHWLNILKAGHRVGPIRAPLEALDGYIKEHNAEPCEYKTNGYITNKEGVVKKLVPSALHPKNITNLEGDDVNTDLQSTKAEDCDFEIKVFDTDQEAITWALDKLHRKLTPSKSQTAPKTLQDENGENPTEEYVTSRKWGLQGKSPVRKTYLNTGKVCVYWRPSFLENK